MLIKTFIKSLLNFLERERKVLLSKYQSLKYNQIYHTHTIIRIHILHFIDYNRSRKSNYNIEENVELRQKISWKCVQYDRRARLDKISFQGTAAVNLIGTFIRGWRRNDDGWKDEPTGEKERLLYPFTKCRGQATKSIAYRFPRTQRLPNRSETILMAG